MINTCDLFIAEEIVVFNQNIRKRSIEFRNTGRIKDLFRSVKLPEGVNLYYKGDKLNRYSIKKISIEPGQVDHFSVEIDNTYTDKNSENFISFMGNDNSRHKVFIHLFQSPPHLPENEFVLGIALDHNGICISNRSIINDECEIIDYKDEPVDVTNTVVLEHLSDYISNKIKDFIKSKPENIKIHCVFTLPIFDGSDEYFSQSIKIKRIITNSLKKDNNIIKNTYYINNPQAIGFYFNNIKSLYYDSEKNIVCLYDSDNKATDLVFMKFRKKSKNFEDKFEVLGITGLCHEKGSNDSTVEASYQSLKWFQMKKCLSDEFLKYILVVGNSSEKLEVNFKKFFGDRLITGYNENRLKIISKGAALSYSIPLPLNYSFAWDIWDEDKLLLGIDNIFDITYSGKSLTSEIPLNSDDYYIQFYLNIDEKFYRLSRKILPSNKYQINFNLSEDCSLSVYSIDSSKVRDCLIKYNLIMEE